MDIFFCQIDYSTDYKNLLYPALNPILYRPEKIFIKMFSITDSDFAAVDGQAQLEELQKKINYSLYLHFAV